MPSRRHFLIKAATHGAAAILGAIPRIASAGDASVPRIASAGDTVASGSSAAGQTREYWIQADSMLWNIVPSGLDDMSGGKYEAGQSSFVTVGYRAYSPGWGSPLPADESLGENAGIPGPVIRARAGDTLVIHFKNNDLRPKWAAHSMHLEGLVGGTENDGFWHGSAPNLPGTAVYPGESYVYRYTVPARAAGAWLYYDYSASRRSKGRGFDIRIYRDVPIYTRARPQDPAELDAPVGAQHGLFGMVIIEDEHTKPADRENVVIFHDLYSEEFPMLIQDFDCINGRSFLSNTPEFRARVGERVRWRVGAIGRENHVFHIHGHRWLMNGAFTDTHMLSPGTTATFEYTEDSAGTWLYHCHFTEHMMGGMAGRYVVS
jgi:FtsP/CotA-like multicopper oxidase with cupredoxin domain